jgi:hypothetical protein
VDLLRPVLYISKNNTNVVNEFRLGMEYVKIIPMAPL